MWQPPFNPLRAPWNNSIDFNDQIDWAVLAKNWIQQKEMFGDLEESTVNHSQHFQPENSTINSLDPALTTVNISDMTNAEATDCTNFDNYYENYETNGDNFADEWQDWGYNSYQNATWIDSDIDPNNFNTINANNLSLPAWAVPPPPPPESHSFEIQNRAPLLSDIQLNMFNLANQNLNQNSTPFNMNQLRPPNFMHRTLCPGFPNMWVPIGQKMPPSNVPKLMGDVRLRMRHRLPHGWANYDNMVSTIDDNFLDANRRRQLPAWIREGLEKMEREKQKKLEKDRRKQLELEARQQRLLQQQLVDPSISKFDESENEEEVEEEEDIGEKNKGGGGSNRSATVANEERGEEINEQISEEEKQMKIILKVKQWMTEILLDVTNEEMITIAESTYRRAKTKQAKAPARQLVSSSALASLSSLGYDSDYDEAEQTTEPTAETKMSDVSESEDEAIFRERLKCKQLQFEKRMKFLEHQNYQTFALPELPDDTRMTFHENSFDDGKDETSSGEIKSDKDEEHITSHKNHNKRSNLKAKISPLSDKETDSKINCEITKRKFEEHNEQNYKSSNGNKNNDSNRRDSRDNRDRYNLSEHIKSFDEKRHNHHSSKKHRKRSKSSERKLSRNDKKNRRNDEGSNRNRESHRHESSSDQSHDNRSHHGHRTMRHKSRSRS